MPRKLTDADIDDLIKRYQTLEPIEEIAASFSISVSYLKSLMSKRGVRRPKVVRRALTPEQADELVRRYLAGESTKQLGPAFGISSRTVSDYLRRAGVKARPKHHGVVDYMAKLTHEERSALARKGLKTRYASMTEEERKELVRAAHDAWRGSHHSDATKRKIAEHRARTIESESAYEAQIAEWLKERGVDFVQQKAVGPYNLDFAIGPVAVEFTTNWARKKKWRDRFAYLFDRGWHLYVIWHDTREALLPQVADDLVAWVKVLESDPPPVSQHRVIWRSRKILSCGCGDADYVASIFKSATPRGHWPLYKRAGDDT